MGFFYRKREKHAEMVIVRDEHYGKKHLIIGGANTALRYISPRGELHTVLFIIMADAVYGDSGLPVSESNDFSSAVDNLRLVLSQTEILHDWPLMQYIKQHSGVTVHLCTDSEWDISYSDGQRMGRKSDFMKLDVDYIEAFHENGMVISVEEFVSQLAAGVKHNAYRKDFPDVSMGHTET